MENIYLIITECYIANQVSRKTIIGAFSTRNQAANFLIDQGYEPTDESYSIWEKGWGDGAEILKIPFNAAPSDMDMLDGVWSCAADSSL